jgi:hypothetical protein
MEARAGRAAAWKHVLATEFVHILQKFYSMMDVNMQLTVLLEHL